MKTFSTSIVIGVFILLGFSSCSLPVVEETPIVFEASFTASPTNCSAPCEVSIVNTSKGASKYFWTFGDGNSGQQDADTFTHVYDIEGIYDIELTVVGPNGSLDATPYTISVEGEKPLAAFSIDTDSCFAPCMVTIINNSMNADSYSWDFGDGNMGNQIEDTFSYTYTAPGEYAINMIATGPTGSSPASSQTVVVQEATYFLTLTNYSNNQKVVYNANPTLQVKLTDQDGNPIQGILIDFEVVQGGGNMVPISTNSNGIVAQNWNFVNSFEEKIIKIFVDSTQGLTANQVELRLDASLVRNDIYNETYSTIVAAGRRWITRDLCSTNTSSCSGTRYNSTYEGCSQISGGGFRSPTVEEWQILLDEYSIIDLNVGGSSGIDLPIQSSNRSYWTSTIDTVSINPNPSYKYVLNISNIGASFDGPTQSSSRYRRCILIE